MNQFAHYKPLDAATNYKAWAKVALINSTKRRRSQPIDCLVDTGADATVLPIGLANYVGLSVPKDSFATLRSAGGILLTLPFHPRVTIEIEKYKVDVPVFFWANPAFTPIIGRLELMAAFDFAFDDTNWYWG